MAKWAAASRACPFAHFGLRAMTRRASCKALTYCFDERNAAARLLKKTSFLHASSQSGMHSFKPRYTLHFGIWQRASLCLCQKLKRQQHSHSATTSTICSALSYSGSSCIQLVKRVIASSKFPDEKAVFPFALMSAALPCVHSIFMQLLTAICCEPFGTGLLSQACMLQIKHIHLVCHFQQGWILLCQLWVVSYRSLQCALHTTQ